MKNPMNFDRVGQKKIVEFKNASDLSVQNLLYKTLFDFDCEVG